MNPIHRAAPRSHGLCARPVASVGTTLLALTSLLVAAEGTAQIPQPCLSHAATSVRVHALQLADRWFPANETPALLDATLAAAATETNPRVQIQLALSLGNSTDTRAFAALAHFAREMLNVPWMNAAILSGLHGRAFEMLVELLREPGEAISFLAPLSQSIAARRDQNSLARVLVLLPTAPPKMQETLLLGLAKGRKNAPRHPLENDAARSALATLAASSQPEVRASTRALEDTFMPNLLVEDASTSPQPPANLDTISESAFRPFLSALARARNPERGHEVFAQACATCHRMGDEGHAVGPDLLGQLGMGEESLLQDILRPSARIRPGYEATTVQTTDGATVTGILKEDGATSLSLVLPNGVEEIVLRRDATGVRRLTTSLMPAFGETLTPDDTAHLLSWLRQQLASPRPP